MPQGPIRPTNAIVVDGNPIRSEYEAGANCTLAKMLPGIFVLYDTTDYAVKEAGAEEDLVLGQLDVLPNKEIDEVPAFKGDPVIVLRGEYDGQVILLSGSAAVVPGDALCGAADGKCIKLAVGAIGAQGPTLGYALESRNPSGSDLWCKAHIHIQKEAALAS